MRRFAMGAGMMIALALVAAPVWAQGTRLSLKGGAAWGSVYGDNVTDDAKSLTRFTGGVGLEFGIAPMLSIQPELLYSLKGATALGTDAGDIRLGYIEIPVLAKLTFGTGVMRPSIFAGPAVAFNTACEIEFVDEPGAVDCGSEDEDVIDVKGTDFSAIVGAGIEYGFGPANLLVDGRFNLGLSSIVDVPDGFDIKNRAFALLVGVSFPLGVR